MVIKCSHCNGMMRLDESRIPKGGGVKIRCPRCNEMDYVEDPRASQTRGTSPLNEAETRTKTDTFYGREHSGRVISVKGNAAESTEPSIPDDAFQGFRFPAEREATRPLKTERSRWLRPLVWCIVSLAVVALFAVLVNIVLSGPGGPKPFAGSPPSGEMNRHDPAR